MLIQGNRPVSPAVSRHVNRRDNHLVIHLKFRHLNHLPIQQVRLVSQQCDQQVQLLSQQNDPQVCINNGAWNFAFLLYSLAPLFLAHPTSQPSRQPSRQPSSAPTSPTSQPSSAPTDNPALTPVIISRFNITKFYYPCHPVHLGSIPNRKSLIVCSLVGSHQLKSYRCRVFQHICGIECKQHCDFGGGACLDWTLCCCNWRVHNDWRVYCCPVVGIEHCELVVCCVNQATIWLVGWLE